MRKILISAAMLAAPLMLAACSPSPQPQTVIVDPPPQRAVVQPGQQVVVPPGSTVRTCPPGYSTC